MLAAIVVAAGLLTAVILREVLATVFFAATVAYVLAPVEEWYTRRGVPVWWASLAATVTGLGVVALVLSPIFVLLYLRFQALRGLLSELPVPEMVTLSLFGFERTVQVAELLPALTDYVQGVALSVASAAPVVAIKGTLFAIVVFALLLARDSLHAAVWAVVPGAYHDAVARLTARARGTLFAIYVLQAATALATFVVAVPLFLALGYRYPLTLATLAGFLQFLPIVGPSVLVVAVALVDVAADNLLRAGLVSVLGLVLVAWLPDPVVRPRLARRTTDLPGSLYFVGFTGGLFTLGVVGVVAGPLVVAVLSESVRLLAEEMEDGDAPTGTESDADDSDGETATDPHDDVGPDDTAETPTDSPADDAGDDLTAETGGTDD